jgi:hypothetical protein
MVIANPGVGIGRHILPTVFDYQAGWSKTETGIAVPVIHMFQWLSSRLAPQSIGKGLNQMETLILSASL